MKKGQFLKRFIMAICFLGIVLVLIWSFFYILTRSVISRNLTEQTRSSSEAILYGIEEELLMLENNALELAGSEEIASMLKEEDIYRFYKTGASLSEGKSPISAFVRKADNVIVFDDGGLFFRLRGSIDNTALNRVFGLSDKKEGGVISVSSGGQNYIGTYEPVTREKRTLGYVALLSEEARIERMIRTYNRSDDIGVILYSGDSILCSDKLLEHSSIDIIKKEADVIYEKEVGLSGFGLLLYSYGEGLTGLTSYFRIALPVTVIILLFTVLFFAWYVKNKMVEPIELIRERTEKFLLKKQINAHFTVNTLNVIRALIYKGNKEKASDTCDELAGLLRYANAGEDLIRLSEEYYSLEQYVKIMQTRYPGLIEMDMEEDDSFEKMLIPRMLLQPIVENAITHGFAGSKGRICISAKTEGRELFIRITDNGRGMEKEKLSALKRLISDSDDFEIREPRELHHISLQNIARRIKTEYGGEYGIEIESEPGIGTEVTVHLPKISLAH